MGLDSSLICVEEGQKLAIGSLLLLLVVLLLRILLLLLVLLSLLPLRNLSLGSLHLNPKVPNFLLIPVDSDWYVIFAEVIADEAISIYIIDVEAVID